MNNCCIHLQLFLLDRISGEITRQVPSAHCCLLLQGDTDRTMATECWHWACSLLLLFHLSGALPTSLLTHLLFRALILTSKSVGPFRLRSLGANEDKKASAWSYWGDSLLLRAEHRARPPDISSFINPDSAFRLHQKYAQCNLSGPDSGFSHSSSSSSH